MSTTEPTQFVCKCGKKYKTKNPYIKHVSACIPEHRKDTTTEEPSDNVQLNVHDDGSEKPRLNRHLAPDAEYLAQVDNDMKNDLQEFMKSGGKLPPHTPL